MRVTVIDEEGHHITMKDAAGVFIEDWQEGSPGKVVMAAAPEGKVTEPGVKIGTEWDDVVPILRGMAGVNLREDGAPTEEKETGA